MYEWGVRLVNAPTYGRSIRTSLGFFATKSFPGLGSRICGYLLRDAMDESQSSETRPFVIVDNDATGYLVLEEIETGDVCSSSILGLDTPFS